MIASEKIVATSRNGLYEQFFMCLQDKSFENTVGKGENARIVFSTCSKNFLPFSSNLKLLSTNSFNLEESKVCRLVKS